MKRAVMKASRVAVALAMGWLAVAAAACDPDEPAAGEVVTMELCPADISPACKPASLVADGHALLTVSVCSPFKIGSPPVDRMRRDDLVPTLTATAGRWREPSDPTKPTVTDVALGRDECRLADLVAPLDPGPIRITAELLGFSMVKDVTFGPAPVEVPDLTASPPSLTAGTGNTLTVAIAVRAKNGGLPSTGTTVSIKVDPTPAAAFKLAQPSSVVLDATGHAQVNVVLGPTVTSAAITATATPPTVEGVAAPDPSSGTITVYSSEP
jgi:hypothetical protein